MANQIIIEKKAFEPIKAVHKDDTNPFEEADPVRVCDPSKYISSLAKRLEGRTGIIIRSYKRGGSEKWEHKVMFPAPTGRHQAFSHTFSTSDLVKVESSDG